MGAEGGARPCRDYRSVEYTHGSPRVHGAGSVVTAAMPSKSWRHDSLTFSVRTTTNSTVPIGGSRRSALRQYGLLFAGILLVVLYELLSTFNVGKIGQPSDNPTTHGGTQK